MSDPVRCIRAAHHGPLFVCGGCCCMAMHEFLGGGEPMVEVTMERYRFPPGEVGGMVTLRGRSFSAGTEIAKFCPWCAAPIVLDFDDTVYRRRPAMEPKPVASS